MDLARRAHNPLPSCIHLSLRYLNLPYSTRCTDGVSRPPVEKSEKDSERLATLLSLLGKSQAEFSRDIGRSVQYVNDIARGRSGISRELAERIHEAYGVSIAWLLMGQGAALPTTSSSSSTNTSTTTPKARVIERPSFYCGECNRLVPKQAQACPHCGARLVWPGE